MWRWLVLCLLVFGLPALADDNGKPATKRPTLPGVEADGSVRLPNTWSVKPAGKQLDLGDFPVNMALHPGGKWLAVLHAGHGDHEIILVDLQAKKERVRSRVILEQTFTGLTFSPDGKTLYASGGEFDVIHAFDFLDGFLSRPRQLKVSDEKFIPGGMAVHPKGHSIYVAGTWGRWRVLLPVNEPEKRMILPLGKDSHPYGCLVDAKGKRLYVSLWNKSAVAVVDLEERKVVQTLDHGKASRRKWFSGLVSKHCSWHAPTQLR